MRHLGLIVVALVLGTSTGCRRAMPPTAPDAMLVEGGSPPPMGEAGVMGRWVGVGHDARGSVRFSTSNGVGRLDFSDDFSVSGVPGPFVYLNTTSNANTGQPLRIAKLRANDGAQSYSFQLPVGVSYTRVLIWCDPFNVPVAEAVIAATP